MTSEFEIVFIDLTVGILDATTVITTGATGPTTGTTTGKTILALHPTRNNIMTIKLSKLYVKHYLSVCIHLTVGKLDATTVIPDTTTGKTIFILQPTQNHIMPIIS